MNTQATPTLQEYFGLHVDPFAPNALPDFYFVGGQRRYLAQRVVHALYFSGSVVLLNGEHGAGKSRMLDEVVTELSELTDSCRIEANVMMDATEIRRLVAARLGLPSAVAQDNATLIVAIAQWQPVRDEPQPIVLIIDDAHLLAMPILAECLQLARSAGGRLKLLLAGEPELIVAWQQAGADAAECIELPSLDRQETSDYLLTRLQAAGLRAELPLSERQLSELYRHSSGNFAAIHACAPALLAEALPANTTSSQSRRWFAPLAFFKDLPRRHIGIAIGLMMIVAGLLSIRGGDNHGNSVATVNPASNNRSVEQRSVPLALPQIAAPTEQPAKIAQQPEQPEHASPASPPLEKNLAPSPPPPPPPPIPKAEPAVPADEVAAQTSDQPAPVVSKSKPTAVVVRDLTEDEQELLGWSANQYVLQLLGAESVATVKKFISGPNDGVKLYSYRARHQDRPWNIVVSGPYADRSAAQAAIATLPPALRNQKPWPRPVTSVQADIRAHRDRR